MTLARTSSISVCYLDDLPVGLGRAFKIANITIAIFRTRSGKLFATDNRCPHKSGPLAEGLLSGDAVVCPLHAFRFDLHDGACDQPETCALQTYPVEQKDGLVYVTIPGPKC